MGRRSCVQLAAYIANMKYHSLSPIHSQTPFSECLEEVKSVLKQCGLLNQPTVLLATDGVAREHQVSWFLEGVRGETLKCGPQTEWNGIIFPGLWKPLRRANRSTSQTWLLFGGFTYQANTYVHRYYAATYICNVAQEKHRLSKRCSKNTESEAAPRQWPCQSSGPVTRHPHEASPGN